MSVTIGPKVDTVSFERIDDVRYIARDLIIRFGDGQSLRLSIDLLSSYGVSDDEWLAVVADEYHIHVPTNHGDVDIPWDVLRYLPDSAFHAEWDKTMRNASRNAGERIRGLREQRGLSISQLAERVGEDEDAIREIEAGTSIQPRLEGRILAALDLTFADLVED